MKKYIIFALLVVAAVLVGKVALAEKPDQNRQLVEGNPSGGRAVVAIPAKAVEMAPGVFSLGATIHQGEVVEGYAFVDYKKAPGKPGAVCGNDVCEPGENARKCPADCGGGEEPDTSSCYGFLAKGAKWKTIEPWVVDPANTEGLAGDFVLSNLSGNVAKWEAAANTDILGSGSATSEPLVADTVSPDGQNEVYFGDIQDPGVIAMAIVWGVFSGPPGNRKLVEWDQVYDQVDYDWSGSGETGKMDFENIATHELGHSVGMADLYTTECSEQTMYGYAAFGETKKRTLGAGDIAGAKALYK